MTEPMIYRSAHEKAQALRADPDGYFARCRAEHTVQVCRERNSPARSYLVRSIGRVLFNRGDPMPARFDPLVAFNGAGGRGYTADEAEEMAALQRDFDEWQRSRPAPPWRNR